MSKLRSLAARYQDMATDVAWSGVSDVLTMVAQLASFVLLIRTLDAPTYGGYVGTYGVIGPLGALTWSGLSLLILQRIIREGDSPQLVATRAYALAIVQGALAVLAAVLIGRLVISTIPANVIFLMAVAELFIFPIAQTSASLVQAVKGFAAAAKLRIFIPLVRLAAIMVPYLTGNLTVRNLAIAWIIGFSIAAAASLFVVLPTIGLSFGFSRPSRNYLRGNLELSLPLTASNLQINGDKAVMNFYGLASDAGLYGAAYRVILLSQLPIRTMNQALFQRFLPDNRNDKGQHLRRAKRFAMVSFPLSSAIAVAIFFVAPLLTFLIGDRISESVTMIRWLLPVVPLLSITRAPLNGLLGLGKTTLRAGVIISSAILSMVMYIALIPALSWRGAVIGTIASELYLAVVGWTLLYRSQAAADNAS